jgi:hypothetical protein
MALQTFYQTVAQLSFTLLGLWWLVLQTKYQEWIGSQRRRRMASSISLYFLLPGSMSLFALLAVPNRVIWQVAFTVAGIVGLVAVAAFRLGAAHSRAASVRAGPGWMWWGARVLTFVLYAAIALVAVFANAVSSLGVAALTVEGTLVSLLVVLGLVLAWAYFISPAEQGA